MLHNQTPQLNFIISDDAIYISSYAGCRKEEAHDENLSLRQYDISDLMIAIETTGSGSGGSGSSGGSSGGGSTAGGGSSGGSSSGGSGGSSSSGITEVLSLLFTFTGGANNWPNGPAGSDVVSNTGSSGSGSTGGGAPAGGAGAGAGGGAGVGGLLSATIDPNTDTAGRYWYCRGPWLMVNHVDRMHKKIEEILAVLRAQTHMQIQIEATYMTFNDDFMKDVGVQWANLPVFNVGGNSIFGGHIPASVSSISYNPQSYAPAPGIPDDSQSLGVFQMAVHFLNSAQTTLLIHAAEGSENAIITSNPHLTCINTVQNQMTLSTTGTYISSYTVQSGIAVPVLATYVPDSTTLTVTPYITADRRYVWLVVSPSFTTSVLAATPEIIPIQGITTLGAAQTAVQVTISTVATTSNSVSNTIKVPDRGTAVLGGLSHVEEARVEAGVPVLSHIPIIKRLFLETNVVKEREHDIFLVSPTIMLEREYEP
jgi:general secretion pathway protein D